MERHILSVVVLALVLASSNCMAYNFLIIPDSRVPLVGRKAAGQVEAILEECFAGAVLDEPPDPAFESATFIRVLIELREYVGPGDIPDFSGKSTHFDYAEEGAPGTGCPGVPNNVRYPRALANQLAGRDLGAGTNPTAVYIEYPKDPNFWEGAVNRYWAGESGQCPMNKWDLVTALLHEALHGMGFSDVVDVTTGWSALCDDNKYRPAKFSCDDHVRIDDQYSFSVRGVYDWNAEIGNVEQRNIGLGGNGVIKYTGLKTLGFVGYWPDLYNPSPVVAGRTLTHWSSPTLNGAPQVMYWQIFKGEVKRSLGCARGVMMDLGWKLKSESMTPKKANTGPKGKNSSKSPTDTAVRVILSNNVGTAQTVNSIALTGQNADQFQIVQGGGRTSLFAYEEGLILVAHDPTTTGLHQAQLQVTLTDVPNGTRTLTSSFTAYGIETDTDGDGISDNGETRDLLPKVLGVNNPFNPALDDSTGDNGGSAADGLLDGQNDYDGDGMTNEMEFFFGYNPLDPASFGICTDDDIDGDGLSDTFETTTFASGPNPFNPHFSDTTGSGCEMPLSNRDLPNGVLDGSDDYDCDGVSNVEEQRLGSDPTVFTEVPAAGLSALALLLTVLLFSGARSVRRRN